MKNLSFIDISFPFDANIVSPSKITLPDSFPNRLTDRYVQLYFFELSITKFFLKSNFLKA